MREHYYGTVRSFAGGPAILIRLPWPAPSTKEVWRAVWRDMKPVFVACKVRRMDLLDIQELYYPEVPRDDVYEEKLQRAFSGDMSLYPNYWLYDWKDGTFELTRKPSVENTYYNIVSSGPSMIVKVPPPHPKWREFLSTLTPLIQAHGLRLKDVSSIDMLHSTEYPDWKFKEKLEMAFSGDISTLKDFWLYELDDGLMKLVRGQQNLKAKLLRCVARDRRF